MLLVAEVLARLREAARRLDRAIAALEETIEAPAVRTARGCGEASITSCVAPDAQVDRLEAGSERRIGTTS